MEITETKPDLFDIQVFPATSERWNNIETLFGVKGVYAGCWCMFWRLDRAAFKKEYRLFFCLEALPP